MAKKKAAAKKKAKKVAPKKKAALKKKPVAAKKSPPKKGAKKAAPRRAAVKSKPARRKAVPARGKQEETNPIVSRSPRGTGAASGGQSGDIQGLSRRERYDSESVEELAEEGQSFESEAVSGVENALDPDQGEVTTHEVPENDVPEEYLDPEQ